MPAFYDLPASVQANTQEDVDRFNKLPFYLVKNEIKYWTSWNVFDQLFGKIDWKANNGNIMKGVTPQRSPVGRALFFPNAITTQANKDIYQVTESVETAIENSHKYESFQFNFLPSFISFWETYLQFANKDIVSKIAISHNQFIETNLWFYSNYVYICGTGLISGVPTNMGNAAGTAANSKTVIWLVNTTTGTPQQPGPTQNARLRDLYNAVMNLSNDLAAPPFDGVRNMPKDNEGIKGKYLWITSSEGYMNLVFDPDIKSGAQLGSISLDMLFEQFRGSLFGLITARIYPYVLRYSIVNIVDGNNNILYAKGSFIPPEIFDPIDQKWKPNPYYTSLISAPYEVNWLLGDDVAKTIKIGPPPKEFAATNMGALKFYGMRWNGEVQLTDQLLIVDANNNVALNSYGENLKFQSKATHGYLPGERRHGFALLVQRQRPAQLGA